MYPKNIRLSKLKSWNQKQFLLSTAITIGIVNPANVISKPLINPKLNEINKSFITRAVEKTGSSVVTIETQKYVKKRQIPSDSQIFLDPYFERFFGLDLPRDNQPRICLLYTSPSPRD